MTEKIAVVLVVLAMAAAPRADNLGALGYCDDTVVIPASGDDCSDGELFCNNDGSCECAYCWLYGGIVPPYYGAWAEAYDLGAGTVVCGAYWLTQIGYFTGRPMDCYVWEGGVTGDPGGVICLVAGVVPQDVPIWPYCGQNDVEMGCCVAAEFTVGYWADFSDSCCEYYSCVDCTGDFGFPWTCIAPGIGFPSGWQHARVVDPYIVSLFIGVYFADAPSPVESATWGSVKRLCR